MKKIILIGNGGHAKSVYDTITTLGCYEIAGFISENLNSEFDYRGCKIIGTDKDLQNIRNYGIEYAFICIGYMGKGNIREKIYDNLKDIGYKIPVIIDSSAIIASDAKIGEGTYIGKLCVVNSDSSVNKMVIINTGAIIEHDNSIGEYSHISVGTTLCGSVTIGKKCFIGANSTVIQGINIADNAIVGAGSTVLADVAAYDKVYGIHKC